MAASGGIFCISLAFIWSLRRWRPAAFYQFGSDLVGVAASGGICLSSIWFFSGRCGGLRRFFSVSTIWCFSRRRDGLRRFLFNNLALFSSVRRPLFLVGTAAADASTGYVGVVDPAGDQRIGIRRRPIFVAGEATIKYIAKNVFEAGRAATKGSCRFREHHTNYAGFQPSGAYAKELIDTKLKCLEPPRRKPRGKITDESPAV